MRYFALAITSVLFQSYSASGSEMGYLCLADMSTGYRLVEDNWEFARFDVSKIKLIIKPTPEIGPNFYQVIKVGSASAQHSLCELVGVSLTCGGLGFGFIMNTHFLRFQEFYGIGYVHGDMPGNTPSITIGRCSPL